jgi:hypothetical protein
MGSIALESAAAGLVIEPFTGNRRASYSVGLGQSISTLQLPATLHIFSILLEFARTWTGLPEEIDR